MQIICIGSSAATSTRKSTATPSSIGARSARVRRRSSASSRPTVRAVSPALTSRRIRAWRGSSIMFSTTPGDGQVLEQRPTVRARAAALRRVGRGIAQHGERLGVGRDRPEALAVRRVLGRRVPVDGGLAAVEREGRVRKAVGEAVEIGEVDVGEPLHAERVVQRAGARQAFLGRRPRGPFVSIDGVSRRAPPRRASAVSWSSTSCTSTAARRSPPRAPTRSTSRPAARCW